MTAQQEASVADERVARVARIIDVAAFDANGDAYTPTFGKDARIRREEALRKAEQIAALWPAPAEDEVEAAARTLIDRLADFQGRIEADHEFREFAGHIQPATEHLRAALSSRQPKPAHDAEVADAAVRRCIAACQVIIIAERDDPARECGAIQCRDALVALLTSEPSK
jgi:hypothetical protein